MSPRTWLLISIVWIAVIAVIGWQQWPRVPLDISTNDPATVAAYHRALNWHLALWVPVALVPPVLLYGFQRIIVALMRRK